MTDTDIIKVTSADPVFAEHAREIHRLIPRNQTKEDILEIGRHLVEIREYVGHEAFPALIEAEFGWSDQTAYRYIHLYEARETITHKLWVTLSVSALYEFAAPNTPEEARREIAEQIEAGEKLSVAGVMEIIGRAKGRKAKPKTTCDDNKVITVVPDNDGDDHTNQLADAGNHAGVGHDAGGAAAETNTAPDMRSKTGNGAEPDTNSTANSSTTLPAPDRVTALANAVNQLSPVELCSFLDQLSPDCKWVLTRSLGKSADKALAEIGQIVSSCIPLMCNPLRHKEALQRKLARMKRITDSEGKSGHKTPEKSNAHLDCDAYYRGMYPAGRPINMKPDGLNSSGVVESSTP
jgi:hypothetical protein